MRTVVVSILALLLVPAPAQGQLPSELYQFLLTADQTTAGVQPGETVDFEVTFYDNSKDSTMGISQQPGVPNASPIVHPVRFEFAFGDENFRGWFVLKPGLIYTQGGDVRQARYTIGVSQLVETPFMPLTLTAVAQANGQEFRSSVNLTVYTLGLQSFNAQPEDLGGEVKPGSVVDVPIRITNAALLPRGFDIEVVENQCGLEVATSSNNLVGAKETKTYTVSARAPEGKLWYFSEICTLNIEIKPSETPTAARVVSAPIIINGGYVDPQWVIWTVEILVVLLILLLLLARRKARIEEEILGKPQKPWLIPVEALYLRALRQKDERAWYVVRHHLMEEEYRSSLLWYKAYKKATKGSRKKEALVIRQEKAYERWKAAWLKDIAKPGKEADRYEAKLQRKLDRKARKAGRKDAKKVERLVAKMRAAHAKQVERAQEAWLKESKRAAKKGLPKPERPVVPEPDYPDEPEAKPVLLADHKWAKKAARRRAKAVRKQGDLEVRFEKADARRLAKLRRKVQRLARKLDDPDFVAEHPLLRADA